MAAVVGGQWGGSCRVGSEQRRAGVSVVMAGGAPRPFIVAGEGHVGARKGETADGNGLNAIEVGRLDEGIKGGLKGGIKAGE
jgi:hypothetical protein